MISGILTNFRLSQAAAIVQNLLELHGTGTEIQGTEAQVATKLVARAFDEQPKLFGGKQGRRPHKLATAATALGLGAKRMTDHPASQQVLTLALGTLLLEIAGKPEKYAFSGNDHLLFDLASRSFLARAAGE